MAVFGTLANLLYPPACLLCHARLPAPRDPLPAAARVICGPCARDMPRSGRPVCAVCGVGLPGAFDARVRCASCRASPPPFEMARAPWRYTGAAQDALRQFKYDGRRWIGRWLAEEMAVTARASLPVAEVSLVLPVPLFWLKRRLKGRNPAEELARAVARSLEKPCAAQALRRVRWTATQTRLSSRQRLRNVRRAFAARERRLRGSTVLLIDDVLTSGSTAGACAQALKQAGASRVFVLTAARTPLE